jgi:lipoate---protein ligase
VARRLPAYHGAAPGALAGAEAMVEGLGARGRPAIRWCTTAPPALYLGASQKPAAVDAAACRAAGLAVYKRASGGTVVLADEGLLGLDVVVPPHDPLWLDDLTQSYRWLGAAWTEALRSVGVPASLVSVQAARADARDVREEARLARAACFGALSPFEVTVQGRKVVGLAQVRRRTGALFQAAVLLRWVPAQLSALLALPQDERSRLGAALHARAVGLDEYLARPVSRAAIIAAVEAALSARGLTLEDDAWTPAEQDLTARLIAERYQPLALGSS